MLVVTYCDSETHTALRLGAMHLRILDPAEAAFKWLRRACCARFWTVYSERCKPPSERHNLHLDFGDFYQDQLQLLCSLSRPDGSVLACRDVSSPSRGHPGVYYVSASCSNAWAV